MDTVDVGSMAGGALVVAGFVQAIRATGKVASPWLPLISLASGIAWAAAVTTSGGFEGNYITGILAGILTGTSASGAQSWTVSTLNATRSSGGGTGG